ncbi:hypothetical protein ABH935_007718 [Catenulispora sp. GAS73]|uniref:hypothetical protein n=1 Tax=Catenulispora sp. GAS73 TaxID=3156269 RepID=UPI00351996F2
MKQDLAVLVQDIARAEADDAAHGLGVEQEDEPGGAAAQGDLVVGEEPSDLGEPFGFG